MVDCPVIEPFIQPFCVVGQTHPHPRFLHTSPEFWMKYLLSHGLEKIFTITYCFRDEPTSPIHRPQFLMLEWYRSHADYRQLMADLGELSQCLSTLAGANNPEPMALTEMTVQEFFECHLGIDILELSSPHQLRHYIAHQHPDVPLPPCDLPWEDYYHLLFLNKLHIPLRQYPGLILTEYPQQLRALSRLKPTDSRVCERFEYFIHGIEIANCYSELTDPQEQERCFEQFNQRRKDLASPPMPRPRVLLHALKRGLPPCAGGALGIERLLQALWGVEQPFFTAESSLCDEA